ncbi:MAG: EthD family reductase [Terracidiphilus sp.]
MIRVSILYPKKPGSRFDVDYYLYVHMPLAAKLLAPGIVAASAEIGTSGAMPEQPPAFWAIAGFTCESVQAFTNAFLPHASELQGDIPKYTDIEPIIQTSQLTEFRVSPVVHARETGPS